MGVSPAPDSPMRLVHCLITTPARSAGQVVAWSRAANGDLQGEIIRASRATIGIIMDPSPQARLAIARRLLRRAQNPP